MRFHITEEGPKECRAKPGDCPVERKNPSAIHCEGEEADAQKIYEQMMEGSLFPQHQDMQPLPLTEATQEITRRLQAAGIRPLLVGGTVRDHLLGIASKDVDLELYGARPDGSSLTLRDVTKVFPRKQGFHVDEAGASFSVVKMRYQKEEFDLALPRTEQSTGEGHRDYAVQHDSTMPFEEASSRRDFTINAMAYDPASGELVDPHGGKRDLRRGVLRHISPAFADDPLRCLRAVNFVSRFGFRIDPETQQLCQQLAPTYSSLASERVEEEFNKVFSKGKYCDRALGALHDVGWAQQMPGFRECSREELVSYGEKLNRVPAGIMRKAALSRLMRQGGHADPTTLLESSSKGRTQVASMNALMEAAESGSHGDLVEKHRVWKKHCPEARNQQMVTLITALGGDAQRLKSLPEKPVEPVVTGRGLLERGYAPGPEMGRLIKRAQRIQDEESLYDEDKLIVRASVER